MNEEKKKNIKAVLTDIFIGVLFYFTVTGIFHPSIVSGVSMYPTYKDGDVLICETLKNLDDYKRGDIIVYKYGYRSVIKRLIALPGETVSIVSGEYVITDKDGNTFFYKDYTYGLKPIEDIGIFEEKGSITLSSDEWFFSGDNRDYSFDCRFYGPVTSDKIRYRIKRKIF